MGKVCSRENVSRSSHAEPLTNIVQRQAIESYLKNTGDARGIYAYIILNDGA